MEIRTVNQSDVVSQGSEFHSSHRRHVEGRMRGLRKNGKNALEIWEIFGEKGVKNRDGNSSAGAIW